MSVVKSRADLKEWWDRRYSELGSLSFEASVRDRNFNRLEITRAIETMRPHLSAGDAVLDAGCGHGAFLHALAEAVPFDLDLVGIELSDATKDPDETGVYIRIIGDAFEFLRATERRFKVVYTQRSVINFLNEDRQLEFIHLTARRLTDDGWIVLSELFRADLDSHNAYRAKLGVEPLGIQKHIVPVDEDRIRAAYGEEFDITVCDYLNTYMLITHIVYPHLAGKLEHNQPIHDFAAGLPETVPGFSPYKLMVLKRKT